MAAAAVKIKPTGELLSISEIAKRCKLDRATVRSRLDDLGYEADKSSTAKNQLYPFDGEMEFTLKSARDTFSAAKIRDLRASYGLKELKLAQANGELVPMHEAVDGMQKLVSSIYQEFTVRQPKRIAPRLAKAKSVTVVRKVLKTDTERIMTNLRQNFKRFLC